MGFVHDLKYLNSTFISIENFTMFVGLFYVFVYIDKNTMIWEHKTPGIQWTMAIDIFKAYLKDELYFPFMKF